MTKYEKEILTGLILSDAHLRQPKSNHRVHMCLSLKHRDFAEEIIRHLDSVAWRKSIFHDSYFDKRTEKTYYRNQIRTRVSDYLTSIYPNWYKDKKKIIPPKLTLTSTVLLWWYLGDGCLAKKKSRPKYRRIVLATQSFTLNEVERLIVQLKELLDSEHVYPESGSIIVACEGICSFANIIGTVSPVKCYDYKFDFGQYLNKNYKAQSYKTRPLAQINEFRKKYKVRELEYVNKNTILIKEKTNATLD